MKTITLQFRDDLEKCLIEIDRLGYAITSFSCDTDGEAVIYITIEIIAEEVSKEIADTSLLLPKVLKPAPEYFINGEKTVEFDRKSYKTNRLRFRCEVVDQDGERICLERNGFRKEFRHIYQTHNDHIMIEYYEPI